MRAAELLTRVLGVQLRSASRSKTWLLLARADVERMGDPLRVASLDTTEAELLASEGDAAGARKALDHALSLLESAGGEPTLEYAAVLRVRAVLPDSPHDVRDAEEALEIATGLLDPGHPSLAGFHRSLCEVLRIHGDLDGAAEHAQIALEIGERAFGPNSPRLIGALATFTRIAEDRGNLAEALAHIRRAISIASSTGRRDPMLASAYETEGGLLVATSDLEAAADSFRVALEVFGESFGQRDSNSARVMIQLGAVERRLGAGAAGMERMRVGLALAEESLGPGHPDVAVIYDAFAVEALRDGNVEEAYDWNLRARDLIETAYGVGTVPTFIPEVNLCESAHAMGNSATAIVHCRRALAIAETRTIGNGLAVAAVENNYGAALSSDAQYSAAVAHFERAILLWSEALGEDSMQVAIAIANLAEVRLTMGDARQALELYRRSLATRERLVGERDPVLVTPLLGSSAAALALGDVSEARVLAEKSIELCAREGGACARPGCPADHRRST
jgi:tetratricopeptide (TPR) repeat protein